MVGGGFELKTSWLQIQHPNHKATLFPQYTGRSSVQLNGSCVFHLIFWCSNWGFEIDYLLACLFVCLFVCLGMLFDCFNAEICFFSVQKRGVWKVCRAVPVCYINAIFLKFSFNCLKFHVRLFQLKYRLTAKPRKCGSDPPCSVHIHVFANCLFDLIFIVEETCRYPQ